MSPYAKAGTAIFTCPVLAASVQALSLATTAHLKIKADWLASQRHFRALTPRELAILAWDGGGHTEWTFSWRAGDHHIDHPANAGVPACGCGRRLVLTACTSDPGAGR